MAYKFYEQMNEIAKRIENDIKDPKEVEKKLKELDREIRSITD